MSERRLNIGLFVGDIADNFSKGICKGAMKAAEELDVNLIIFPGKYYDRDSHMYDGIQYEYQHNTLFTYVFEGKIDLLIIAIGSIGYLSTEERRKAFLDYFSFIPILTVASEIDGYEYVLYDNERGVMQEVEYLIEQGRKKIGYLAGPVGHCEADERLNGYKKALEKHGIEFDTTLIERCNMSGLSEEAAKSLIERNPDLDAIACINDTVAKCVCKILRNRGITVGKEVAVVGYDDLSYVYKWNPPLATVRADATLLGSHAVYEGVNNVLNHKPVNHRMPVEFIPRSSAGDGDKTENTACTPLIDITVEQFLDDNHSVNMISRDMFNFDKFVDQNYALLLERLYWIDIQNCYLYLFPTPKIHLADEMWIRPSDIYLKACLCDGKVMSIPRHCQKYPINELYSHEYMPNRRYTMILLDLFTTDTQHGLLLMELNYDKHYFLEAIAYQMSAAIRMLSLMQMQEETQKRLEDSLQQLEMHNIQLDSVARKDPLTQLLNRRGFEMQVEELLRDTSHLGKYILTVYADMDNLKIVNDRFGHSEGDFALQSIAKMLKTMFEEDDIIGRIGGDEFAVFALREEPIDMKKFREKVNTCVEEFNRSCDKPYYIRMTAGGYTQSFMLGCKLWNLLENADDDLYEAKKVRTKDIMKTDKVIRNKMK